MAENRYTGSVDEIIENVRRQQAGKPAANDSEVDAILASLGLGGAPAAPKAEQPAPEKAPEQKEEPKPRPAAPAAPKATLEGATGEIRLELPEDKTKSAKEQTTDEICLDFVRAGLEQAAQEKVEKKTEAPKPAEKAEPDPEEVKQPAPQPEEAPATRKDGEVEEDEDARELRRRFEKAAAASAGIDGDTDGSFVDFFSDHVAVIPDEEEESPTLFNRFIKRRKKEEFAEAAQDPSIMMPGVSEPGKADEPT
ncbi:MAG: hypothetical protein IIV90_02985, partial [Oscillospiraceae bacterium]|nr:hypothetical protein [Oscillospiraceae bacterium]